MPHLSYEFLRAFYTLSGCAEYFNGFINSTADCFYEEVFFRTEGAHNICLAYSSCFGNGVCSSSGVAALTKNNSGGI